MPGEIKFTQLPTGSAITDADIFPSVQSGVSVKQPGSAITTYAQTKITLQNAYNVSSPKEIKFGLGSGLAFVNSTDDNVFIISDTATSCLEPFVVSKTGTDGISVIQTTDPDSTVFEVKSTTYGSISEPVMSEIQRNVIDISGTPIGLGVFTNTTKTRDYYDGTSWQKILNTQNVSGSGTVTVTDNGDGTIDVFGSGGSTTPAASFAAYSVINNSAPRPATTAFGAVPISSGFTDVSDQNFTSQTMTIAGVNTVGSTYTGTDTNNFQVNQSCVLRSTDTLFREYYYAIAILRVGGSIETTLFQGYTNTNQTILFPAAVSLNGIVTLSTGDTVFTQIVSFNSSANSPTYTITSEVSSIAGTAIPTFQEIYDNDPEYPASEVNLATNGSIQFNYGSDVSFGAGLNGIASTSGLRLLPSNGIESIEALVTDDPTTAIFTVVSTIRGSKPLPDMTTAQRDLISGSNPVALGIYDISINTPQFWTTDNTLISMINDQYAQTIGGVKTFSSNIIGNLTGNAYTATRATNATNAATVSTSTNASFFPIFVASSSNSNQPFNLGTGLNFNPSTNNLTTTTFTGALSGNASSATILQTARAINGVSFNGSADITITAVPGGSASGDLSGTYPSPTVAKINGVTLGSTTATSGNLLIGSGTQWVTNAMSGNVTINSTGVTTIGASQVTNSMLAGSIDLTSKVTNDLPFSNGGFGFHTATTGDIFYASGTNTPNKLADVATGQVLVSGGVGVVPAYSATPTLTSLTLPNGQGLVLGATTANQLTITSASGAGNRADIVLNRNDFTNGNCRFFFQTATTNEWSNGMRGGSGDYQIFDEVNAVTQLRMTQASGTTAVSTFAGQVIINGLGGVNSLVATNASKQLTTTVSGISPTFTALTLSTGDLTVTGGNILIGTAAKSLSYKSGANGCTGTSTLVAGTVS